MASIAFSCSDVGFLTVWSGPLKRRIVNVASFEVGYSQILKTCPGKMGVRPFTEISKFVSCPLPKTYPTHPDPQPEGHRLKNATVPMKCLSEEAIGLGHPAWKSQAFFWGRCPGQLRVNEAFDSQQSGNVGILWLTPPGATGRSELPGTVGAGK